MTTIQVIVMLSISVVMLPVLAFGMVKVIDGIQWIRNQLAIKALDKAGFYD